MSEIEPATEAVASRRAPDAASIVACVTAAYDAHASAIYGLALRATRDPDLAADVTQEVFLRLLVEARNGRYPDNVGGWLYRASKNLIINKARRATVARRFSLRREEPARPDEPDAIALGNEQHRELAALLDSLPIVDRIALVMAAQGASGEEIAERIGRSHVATRTLMSRARARLRTAALRREASR